MRVVPALALALALVLSAAGAAGSPVSAAPQRSGETSTAAAASIPWPSPGTNLKVVPGKKPGTVKISWRTEGVNTDFYRFETGTSPWDKGPRDHHVFKIPGDRRSYTLSPKQTMAAGVGVGVGWTMVWRMYAVNKTKAGQQARYYGQGQSRVTGSPARGSGSPIRVASYNMRTDDTWDKRAPLIAKTIASRMPGVVLTQELFPSQVSGLEAALGKAGLGEYRLTRRSEVPAIPGIGQHKLQARILYDSSRYEMVGDCSGLTLLDACVIPFDSDGGEDYASYALLREKASQQEFWVTSFHLTNGEKLDAMRTAEARTIMAAMAALNKVLGLPMVVGGDSNSSQLRPGPGPTTS